MSLKEQLQADLKTAMKEKDKIAKQTVTMIRAAILQVEKDNHVALDDQAILDIIGKQMKQRKDALADFEKAGREDLIEQAKGEIEVIKRYLPEQLTPEAIEKIVEETMAEVGAETKKDMGKLMGALMPKVKGLADGKVVSSIVQSKLK